MREDEFHLEQAKLRAQIRIREGRAKPIDIIAKNLIDDDPTDFEMTEPHKLFRDLSVEELVELKGDIAAHADLDKTNGEFWMSLAVVCDDELSASQRREARKNRYDTLRPFFSSNPAPAEEGSWDRLA